MHGLSKQVVVGWAAAVMRQGSGSNVVGKRRGSSNVGEQGQRHGLMDGHYPTFD